MEFKILTYKRSLWYQYYGTLFACFKSRSWFPTSQLRQKNVLAVSCSTWFEFQFLKSGKIARVSVCLRVHARVRCVLRKPHSYILRRRNLKTAFALNAQQMFSARATPEFKPQQSPVILDFCSRESLAGDRIIFVTQSVSKSFIFKMFSFHTKTPKPSLERFQILTVWRAVSKSSVFVTD